MDYRYGHNASGEYQNSEQATEDALREYRAYLVGHVFGMQDIEFKDMPKYADSDYMVIVNGQFQHFLEVKSRRHNMYRYEKTKMPLRKHAVAKYWKDAKDWDTYFLCKWTDCCGVFDLSEEPDSVEDQVARYDRGEEKDIYAFYRVRRARRI